MMGERHGLLGCGLVVESEEVVAESTQGCDGVVRLKRVQF